VGHSHPGGLRVLTYAAHCLVDSAKEGIQGPFRNATSPGNQVVRSNWEGFSKGIVHREETPRKGRRKEKERRRRERRSGKYGHIIHRKPSCVTKASEGELTMDGEQEKDGGSHTDKQKGQNSSCGFLVIIWGRERERTSKVSMRDLIREFVKWTSRIPKKVFTQS